MTEGLQRGSKGPDVRVAQEALQRLGYYKGALDSDFGPMLEAAVVKWEQERYADGSVGKTELDYFRTVVTGVQTSAQTAPVALPKLPVGQAGLIALFGEPWADGSPKGPDGLPTGENWWKKWAAPATLPAVFNLNQSDTLYVNKYIDPVVEATFAEIAKCGLASEVKTFDGCFKIRPIRGYEKANPPKWSVHTWGMAVDINAAENGLGVQPKLSPALVACFKKFGWRWGGDFTRLDGMHFEYLTGA